MVNASIRFLKRTFTDFTLGYNKHAKFNCLCDIICFLLVKVSKDYNCPCSYCSQSPAKTILITGVVFIIIVYFVAK